MPVEKLTPEQEKAKERMEIEFTERARASLSRAIQRANVEKDDVLYIGPLEVLRGNIDGITKFLTTPPKDEEKKADDE